MQINIVSMGCSKNLVDSERLMKRLSDAGFDVKFEMTVDDADLIDIVVVNTCGFIGDAKEESINTILAWGELRSEGRISGLYVMGCLSERHGDELKPEIPEVDGWYGKFDWGGIVSHLAGKYPSTADYDRMLTTPSHYCYMKISEGCNRFCAFCAIPLITGRHHSRPIEEIVEETKMLAARGVKEFNVIAQDLSAYGSDLDGGRSRLAELIDRMADVEGVEWIRLHYAYPADFPLDILDVMAARPNVCRYLDIALQHGSDKVLEAMRRHIDTASTERLLDEIRRRVPGIHIRTTMMTGFPGEDDEAFEQMLGFVRRQRFERLGAFAYCEEEGTFAARNLPDTIPDEVKRSRLDKLMALQQEIASEEAEKKIGQRMRVVVDSREGDTFYCRSEFDSPEVDPEVILIAPETEPAIGTFIEVEITATDNFDLIARRIEDSGETKR